MPVDVAGTMVMANCFVLLQVRWQSRLHLTSSFFVRIESNAAFRIFFRLDFTTIFLREFKLQLITKQ